MVDPIVAGDSLAIALLVSLAMLQSLPAVWRSVILFPLHSRSHGSAAPRPTALSA